MFALINEGVVVELFAARPVVHSEVLERIVPVPENVEVGWIVDAEGGIHPPDKPESYETWNKALGAYVIDTAARDAARRVEIMAALTDLDASAIRPTRAILAAQLGGQTPDIADATRLGEIEVQAQALREELAELNQPVEPEP